MNDTWKTDLAIFIHGALDDMYKSKRHTDIDIVVDQKTFSCHKAILAAVSPYFDAMFSSGMRECIDGIVTIHGVTSQIFENILSFVYSGRRVVTTENVEELIKAAAIFQVRYLHEKCEQFLLDKVCSDNCIGAWKLAKSHDCPTLCRKAWTLIMENFTDICRSEDFTMLDVDDIIAIITDDSLMVANEELVCDSVFRWYNIDPSKRKEDTVQIFEHLRLPLLGSEYLLHEIEPMDIVMENTRCREIVKEAITYQMLLARRPEFNSPRIAFRRHSTMEEVLVIIGGYNAVGEKVTDMLAYSFNQNRWFNLTPLPMLLGREFATCVYGNDLFVSGGSQKLDCLLRYRSDNNDWYRCTTLLNGRRRHAMVAVGGYIYVLGGYDDNCKEEANRTLSSVEEYDIQTRSWKKYGHLQIPVRSMAAGVCKEKIFVFGGILADDKETDIIQSFDTRLMTCCLLSGMPTRCKLAKTVVQEKRMFVVCTDGSILEMTEDGKCRTIKFIGNFSRRRFAAIHHKGLLMVIGGESGNTVHTDVLSFNPETKEIGNPRIPSLPSRANFGGLKIVVQKKFLTREYKLEKENHGTNSTSGSRTTH